MQYDNFNKDFIERTIDIINDYKGDYDATLYINCCIGLICLPNAKYLYNAPIHDFNNGSIYGISMQKIAMCKNSKGKDSYTFKTFIKHMRNSIAHSRVKQSSIVNGEIESLIFTDEKNGQKNFKCELTIDEFKKLALDYANYIVSQILRQEAVVMKVWENRLQNQVDEIIYNWMRELGKASTTPPECIEFLVGEEIYNSCTKQGLLLRNDLRDARKASGVSDSDKFIYNTKHLRFEQEKKYADWDILLR